MTIAIQYMVIFIKKYIEFSNFFMFLQQLNFLKRPKRAAHTGQWGRMRPAGRQFDMPVLKEVIFHDSLKN